ncbi:MAG: putative membrane protein YeiB [Paraglaciecola sp.]|jgi:uncharacterized membrane protein YeiB
MVHACLVKVNVLLEDDKLKRIMGVDFARALAVFGMVIVNFKLAMNAANDTSTWHLFAGLFEGRASALFVILAGIGIAFMTKNAILSGSPENIKKSRWSLIKRALLLFVIGLAYTPIWEADILHFYGFYFLIAACLFTLSDKALLSITAGFVLAFPVLCLLFDYEQGWDWATLTYTGLWTLDGMLRHIVFNGFHPIFPWCGFLIFGIWLGRRDLTHPLVRRSLFKWSLSILVVTEVCFYMLQLLAGDGTSVGMSIDEINFLFSTSIIPPLPQYILSAGSSAVLVLLGCVKLTQSYPTSRLNDCINKTGQLSLTLYVAHVIVGMGTLEALGLLYNQSIQVSLLASLLFCIASVMFSVFWLSRFKIGPLEWLFKKLSH